MFNCACGPIGESIAGKYGCAPSLQKFYANEMTKDGQDYDENMKNHINF